MFVAVRGAVHNGHDYIEAAIAHGAVALLVEERQNTEVPQIVVPDTRSAMAWAARCVYGMPDDTLSILGVTGTNGKTTVTHMLESIFESAGTQVGVIGTLGARIGEDPIPTLRTTPEATDLQRILATMRDSGVGLVLMEVSSHAIELHRSDAIHFSIIGFTNLSQDHLDFHGDMESYFAVKKRVFDSRVSDRAVVNICDPWGKRLVAGIGVDVTSVCASGDADVRATDSFHSPSGTRFVMHMPTGSEPVTLPLMGDFNVSNALVAAGMAMGLGLDPKTIAHGLTTVDPIAGRMELIAHNGPFTVVVDYAHTPDAVAAVLGSLNAMASGRVIALIGAGGDRDRDKRSIMGAAASRLSDVTIITTDNPRTEDPVEITAELRRGAEAQPHAVVETIIDRRSAIRRGIRNALSGDVIVILGKGHEQGQDVGSEILPFDDRDEARHALKLAGWEPS